VDAVTAFEPETLINYEIGIKSDWDRVRANVSAFFMDFTDMQVRTVNSDGAVITSNAGASEIKGIELELTYLPVDSLTLGLNYAYLDAEFIDFIDGGVDYSGNTIPRSPENTVSASITYYVDDLFATGGSLELGIDYAWRDKRFDDYTNQAPEIVPAFSLLDARAVYTFPDSKWQVSLWGSNLTDKEYPVHNPDFGLGTWYLFAPPRTFGVTLNWNYQ
jgi:iron complex outermembrane receptor protein